MKPYKCIQIFNNEDELMYEIENSFKRNCESLKLPYESLRKSFAKNGAKLYQGRKQKKEGQRLERQAGISHKRGLFLRFAPFLPVLSVLLGAAACTVAGGLS
jgi:hypothetical protein